MNEELMLNSEEEDAIHSYKKFSNLGFEFFSSGDYERAIKNMEKALSSLEIYIPTNIKFILENLSHRLLFLGLRNELLLQLGISYRKLGYYYKARGIFEDLLYFCKEFDSNHFLGFEDVILGFYPIPKNELLRRVWSEIGLIYKDLKMYNKALDAFYKSTCKPLNIFSRFYPNSWLEIADLHDQLGDSKKARLAKKEFKKTHRQIKKIVRKRGAQW